MKPKPRFRDQVSDAAPPHEGGAVQEVLGEITEQPDRRAPVAVEFTLSDLPKPTGQISRDVLRD